ncbi:unnamed protein product [Lathyrus sativus]|nr:unnamed protein product [Lathyrus sativus]
MLNDLPDCVILHILSFLDTKDAVRTCILSVRWKDLWKSHPALTLDFVKFTHYDVNEFVSKVLSLRDSSISLQSVNVRLLICGMVPLILTRILSYAVSHNVHRLEIEVCGHIAQILPTMFSSLTLTHLELSIHSLGAPAPETIFPNSLNLPALTNLQLENISFSVGENGFAEPFSTFPKLNSLFLYNCNVGRSHTGTLCISSSTLVNLTMYNHNCIFYKIDLRSPSLCKFVFTGNPYHKVLATDVSSLKHLDMVAYRKAPPLFLFNWLLEFVNIESLTVSAATLQVLSLIPNLLKMDFPSLVNLKSLKVIMGPISYGFRMTVCQKKLRNVKSKEEAVALRKAFANGSDPSLLIPDGIVDFLLQNSPLAEVYFIGYKKL